MKYLSNTAQQKEIIRIVEVVQSSLSSLIANECPSVEFTAIKLLCIMQYFVEINPPPKWKERHFAMKVLQNHSIEQATFSDAVEFGYFAKQYVESKELKNVDLVPLDVIMQVCSHSPLKTVPLSELVDKLFYHTPMKQNLQKLVKVITIMNRDNPPHEKLVDATKVLASNVHDNKFKDVMKNYQVIQDCIDKPVKQFNFSFPPHSAMKEAVEVLGKYQSRQEDEELLADVFKKFGKLEKENVELPEPCKVMYKSLYVLCNAPSPLQKILGAVCIYLSALSHFSESTSSATSTQVSEQYLPVAESREVFSVLEEALQNDLRVLFAPEDKVVRNRPAKTIRISSEPRVAKEDSLPKAEEVEKEKVAFKNEHKELEKSIQNIKTVIMQCINGFKVEKALIPIKQIPLLLEDHIKATDDWQILLPIAARSNNKQQIIEILSLGCRLAILSDIIDGLIADRSKSVRNKCREQQNNILQVLAYLPTNCLPKQLQKAVETVQKRIINKENQVEDFTIKTTATSITNQQKIVTSAAEQLIENQIKLVIKKREEETMTPDDEQEEEELYHFKLSSDLEEKEKSSKDIWDTEDDTPIANINLSNLSILPELNGIDHNLLNMSKNSLKSASSPQARSSLAEQTRNRFATKLKQVKLAKAEDLASASKGSKFIGKVKMQAPVLTEADVMNARQQLMQQEILKKILGRSSSSGYQAHHSRPNSLTSLEVPEQLLQKSTYAVLSKLGGVINMIRLFVTTLRKQLDAIKSENSFQFEVNFCLDNSLSMKGPRGNHMLTALTIMMETLRRLEIRFSVIKFAGSGTQKILKEISEDLTEKRGEAIIEEMTFTGGTHAISGLKLAITEGFGENPQPSVYRAVIMLTDGVLTSGNPEEFLRAIQASPVPISFCIVNIFEGGVQPVEIKNFLQSILNEVAKSHKTTYSIDNNLVLLSTEQVKTEMAVSLAKMLEKQINQWMIHFRNIPSSKKQQENKAAEIRIPTSKLIQVPNLLAIENQTGSIQLKDLYSHSQLQNSEINTSAIQSDDRQLIQKMIGEYSNFQLESIKKRYEVELRSEQFHNLCIEAANKYYSLKEKLQPRINELSEILGDYILPINRYTRKKPTLHGSTIHIPSLIRFVISNYQYRRFLLQKIAGGKHNYNVCIVIDVSSSLVGFPIRCNFEVVLILIEALQMLGITSLSLVTFANQVTLVKSEQQTWDQRAIYEFITSCQGIQSSSSLDASAVCFATSLLLRSSSGGNNKMFVFSDGYSSQGSLLSAALEAAENSGIQVISTCIGLDETNLPNSYPSWIQCVTPNVYPEALRSWSSNRIVPNALPNYFTQLENEGSIQDVWKNHKSIFDQVLRSVDDEKSVIVDVIAEDSRSMTIDLAFAMDCTGSMGSWIEAARTQTTTMIRNLETQIKEKTSFNASFRLSFIAYRDHCDGANRLNIKPFTTNSNDIVNFIQSQSASGGGDTPEDIAGALDAATKLDWKGNTRVLVLVSDAPCHGKKYHSYDDSYPSGDPLGLVPEKSLEILKGKNVRVLGLMCGSCSLDQMYSIFKSAYDSPDLKLETHKLGNSVDLMQNTVSESVLKGVLDFL